MIEEKKLKRNRSIGLRIADCQHGEYLPLA